MAKSFAYSEEALKLNPKNLTSLVNKATALKEMSKKEESLNIYKYILIQSEADEYLKACCYAGIEDKPNMLKSLAKSIHIDLANKVKAKYDPDFRYYHDDPDFLALIN